MFTVQCQCTTTTTTATTTTTKTTTAASLGDRQSAYDSAVEDSYCDGYQADTEDQWACGEVGSGSSHSRNNKNNSTNTNTNNNRHTRRSSHSCEQHSGAAEPTIGSFSWRWQLPSTAVASSKAAERQSLSLFEQIDLCRAAVTRAANAAKDTTEGTHSSESSLAIINSLARSCRENSENSRILFENEFTTLLTTSFSELLLSSSVNDKALRLAVFDLLEELCKVRVRSTELRLLLNLFKADTADLDFLLSTTNKILFPKWQQQSEANQPQYSVRFPVQSFRVDSTLVYANLANNNVPSAVNSLRPKKMLWLDTIMGNIRTHGAERASSGTGARSVAAALSSSSAEQQHQMAFKTAAIALPFHSAHITNFHYSFVVWIYLDRISPLIDKYRAFSSSGTSIKSQVQQLLPPPKIFSSHHFEYGSMTESTAAASAAPSVSASAAAAAAQCIHITSLNFNSSTVELWFDYIYNRFVYRICKENGGRLIYFNENFVANSSANLGRWNFLRVNVEQIVVPKARNSVLKIAHSTNCSKDETIKLSYPLNLLEKGAANAALLLGATTMTTTTSAATTATTGTSSGASSVSGGLSTSLASNSSSSSSSSSSFSYRLGNLLLFNQHLQPPSTVFLFSLGADFSHPHHLRSEWITKENYFTLPKTLLSSKYGGESISALHSCIAPSFESKLLLRHLILLYSASSATVYYSSYHPQKQQQSGSQQSSDGGDGVASRLQSKLSFSRFYPSSISSGSSSSSSKQSKQKQGQQQQQQTSDQMKEHRAVLYCGGGGRSASASGGNLKVEQNVGIAKTIADTGGISLFLFLLCYVFERSEDDSGTNVSSSSSSSRQAIQQKAMELLLRAYESHYQHRLHFDTHLAGHRLLLYVLQKSVCSGATGGSYSTTMLRLFAQFSIDSAFAGHSVVLSQTALEVFLSSWRVWSSGGGGAGAGTGCNFTTLKLFFAKLESLVSATNPYRNYNLAQLRRVNAFSRLLCMIKDMYSDYSNFSHCDEEEKRSYRQHHHQHHYHLDGDSLAHVIALFNAIIDSSSDLNLFKAVFNCLLLLQRTELLHINQTRASFYFLCLPTWTKSTNRGDDADSSTVESSSLPESTEEAKKKEEDDQEKEEEEEAPLNLEDWEIVSEMLDQSANAALEAALEHQSPKKRKPPSESSKTESSPSSTLPLNDSALHCNNNADLVVNQLLLLLNRFVDQLSEISLIDAIFEQVLCLDYLLVFINTPSDRVREIALRTYFKFYSLLYEKEHPSRSRSRTATIASAEFTAHHERSASPTDISISASSSAKRAAEQQQLLLKISPRTLDLLLLANQLYQYVATEETVLACLGFLLDVSRKSALDLLNNQESRGLLRKCLLGQTSQQQQNNSQHQHHQCSSIPLENFIPLLSVLPRCTSSPSFAHRVLQTVHRILVLLSVEQVIELQQVYGLAQALSRLVVALNSPSTEASVEEDGRQQQQPRLAEDDLNRLTREHVNAEIILMLSEIAQRYLMRTGGHYFSAYSNLLHYYAIMERKVVGSELRGVFRDIQVGLLQSAFECLLQLQKGYRGTAVAAAAANFPAKSSRKEGLDLLSEQFIHMFSGNDFVSHSAAADLSFDYSAQADADADQKVDRDLVKPKEALERMRFAVKQATGFVVFRDDIEPSQKEVYFQREVLFHLLTIIEHIESANIAKAEVKSRVKATKSAATWNALLAGSKDAFKEHLTQMVLFLLSPFQTSIADRVFSLNLLTEKTHSLDHLKLFIDHRGGGGGGVDNFTAFAHLFEAFLGDLQEKGVRNLAITSLSKYSLMGNDEQLPESSFSNDSISDSQDSSTTTTAKSGTSTLEGVLAKFKSLINHRGQQQPKSESFYRTLIASWYESIEQRRAENETSIRLHVNRIFSNMLPLYGQVSDAASLLNEKIVQAQHREKKAYIEHLRAEANEAKAVRRLLLSLMAESLHEKAAWHMDAYCPQSWALSPFESRNRTRQKLERAFLEIGPRYLMPTSSKLLSGRPLFASFLGGPSAVSSSSCFSSGAADSSASPFTLGASDAAAAHQLPLYTSAARVILFDEEIEGEILLKSTCVQFFASTSSSQDSGDSPTTTTTPVNTFSKKAFFSDFVIHFAEVCELNNCRYELQNTALEIHLTSGLTYLIAFEDVATRDEFVRQMTASREALPALTEPVSLVTLTQLWRERRISNFEYLTHLNKLSGRTSNDLMQYPVFPFVLADYTSEVLNLMEAASFRVFSRPIAVQKKERERHYVDQYNYIKAENERLVGRANGGTLPKGKGGGKGGGGNNRLSRSDPDLNAFQFVVTAAPYHYGSHYSNSGIVLHYLVRLPPYTQMFLQYQDRNFDIADRAFHSIHTTWRLATEDSTNGFKELIPEFFYLPEFLLNSEQFNLGVRQDGDRVDDVRLPPWARGSARLFTLIHRQALEANLVTRALHSWIDLIFGHQQSGRAAVEAVNVFHPATHYSADLSKIEDEVKRGAIKTMIKTFGQMPAQLFNMPHPGVSAEAALAVEDDFHSSCSVPEVIGIKWGEYVGSPLYGKPRPSYQRQFSLPIARLWALPTNDVVLLPACSALLVGYSQPRNPFINTLYILSYSLVTWSTRHSTVWLKSNKEEQRVPFTAEAQFLDKICIAESVPYYDRLLVGYQSGLIVSFSLNQQTATNNSHSSSSSSLHHLSGTSRHSGGTRSYTLLYGHRAAVRSISLNKNYSIALSSDATGVVILWDMGKQMHLRTIIDTEFAFGDASLTTISDTLGDLAVVSYRATTGRVDCSQLAVFTINGRHVGKVITGGGGGSGGGGGGGDPTDSFAYITSLCYSTCTEGLAVNAIATGLSNGAIKLWSSWDLTLLRTIKLHRINIPIRSISFSYTNDILFLILEDDLMVALENSSSTHSPPSTLSASTEAARKNFRIIDLTPDHTDSIL